MIFKSPHEKEQPFLISENPDSPSTPEYLHAQRGSPLSQALQQYSDGTGTRIICVEQFTPIVTKLLGLKFNISADFFNDHLPRSASPTPLRQMSGIFHLCFS